MVFETEEPKKLHLKSCQQNELWKPCLRFPSFLYKMLLIIQCGVTIKEECGGKMWKSIDIPANMLLGFFLYLFFPHALYNGTHRIYCTTAQTPHPMVLPVGGGMPYPAIPHIYRWEETSLPGAVSLKSFRSRKKKKIKGKTTDRTTV